MRGRVTSYTQLPLLSRRSRYMGNTSEACQYPRLLSSPGTEGHIAKKDAVITRFFCATLFKENVKRTGAGLKHCRRFSHHGSGKNNNTCSLARCLLPSPFPCEYAQPSTHSAEHRDQHAYAYRLCSAPVHAHLGHAALGTPCGMC